ncbi:hypothetical protein AQUCO_01400383v1 [Aquilegia coerulea]|uniref:WAT1-related protein n=1 Tax=Aquilegia coerulea TaxID=218851 RepID=A0A2G5DWV9_AQUCA|nr:hypothetical protein AQUCO_01400383v1 [Aquilegia coerulea]
MWCNCGNVFHGLKPAMMMVLVQVVFAGVNIFYKLAITDGMSLRVLVAYRYLFAAAFLAPLAFFLERKSRPKLTWMILFQAFLCGLFGGSLAQNLYVMSLNLTSATFATAMNNLIPAITFTMAVTFGLEKMAIRTLGGKAKVLGTLLGLGGAMLLTFYKGIEINLWSAHLIHLHDNRSSHAAGSHGETGNRVLGAILALGSCLCYATWLIIQTKMSEKYPCQYSSTALMCVMGSVQAVIFALCMERDWTQWKLGWNIRLLTVAYTGILASGLIVTVVSWCVRLRGPLFVSIFNPLMLVLVALAGSILLNEKLHLGSVLGAVLIVIGLYMVLWGKSKDLERISQLMLSKSSRVSSDDIEVVISSPNNNCNNSNVISIKPESELNSAEITNMVAKSLEDENNSSITQH